MSEDPHYVTPEEAEKQDCAVRPHDYWCQGPRCMAWRWKLLGYEELKDGSGKCLPIYSRTHGYCGMVRG